MTKLTRLVIAGLFCAVLSGCYKYEHKGEVPEPGIALTFDDKSIDNWYQYLPLLDSFDAKVTFYISSYHTLTAAQRSKLHEMERRGHEIAYHTTFHNDLCKYKKEHGISDLMDMEIGQDLRKMRRDGFNPVSFAYPYGAHDGFIDNQLLRTFRSVRALNGSTDLSKSVTKTTSNTLLYALGLDGKRRSWPVIERMIDDANINHNCLVLVGHQINNPNYQYSVDLQKLRWILMKAKKLGMRFYTIAEISAH